MLIKFDSHLPQVGGFFRILWFLPPIKLTPHTITEILLKVSLNTIILTHTHSSVCHLLTYIIYSFVIVVPHYVRPNIKQFYSKGRNASKCATRYNWGCVTHYNLLFNHCKCSWQTTETLKGHTIY